MDFLKENEYVVVDGRGYVNPQTALDESNQFIDNLRSMQQTNNQQIQTDTYNLGTAVPSSLGGLTSPVTDGNGGAGLSYFTSRYQTPETASAVANLRATAQAAALNQALENEQAIWKKKYNDTYRSYQKRANSGGGSGGGGAGGDGGDNNTTADQTTIEIVDVNTDPIAKSIYLRKFQEYIKQGMTAQEAEAQTKADLGLSD